MLRERRLLQRTVALVALLPVAAGLYGVLTGVPSFTMLAALVLELGLAPLLCLWQARVAGLARDAAEPPL